MRLPSHLQQVKARTGYHLHEALTLALSVFATISDLVLLLQ
jgi:hypothetical protein